MILDNLAGLFSNNTGSYVTQGDFNSTLGVILIAFITFIGFVMNALEKKFTTIGQRLETAQAERSRIELDIKLQLLEIKTIVSMSAMSEGITLNDQDDAIKKSRNEFLDSQDED